MKSDNGQLPWEQCWCRWNTQSRVISN